MKNMVRWSVKPLGIGAVAMLSVLTLMVSQGSAEIYCTAQNDNGAVFTDNLEHTRQCCTTGVIASNRKVAILFNAECAVSGADDGTFVDTDIEVDGVEIYPSQGNDNALCTSSSLVSGGTLKRWVSGATNVVATLTGGAAHTVCATVILRNFTAGESYRIDDSTLIVVD